MAMKHKIKMTPHSTKSRTYQLTAHYLDRGYPAEVVAEIVGVDVDYVHGVEEYESRFRV